MRTYLAEVFNVIYLGRGEIKPEKQIGTIKVQDDISSHYLYEVNYVDMTRPTIQPGDELILAGPNLQSFSSDILEIDIDLFCGDYKGSICYDCYPCNQRLRNKPIEKRIISKDGTGEILVLYSLFNNSVEAHLEIKLLTNDNSATANLHGVVAASISDIDRPACSSMLFLKKPGYGINVGRGDPIPLSRSIVAVPYESMLYLDFHLVTGEDDIVEGYLEFDVEPGYKLVKRFSGKKGEFIATVSYEGEPDDDGSDDDGSED
ncbi:hypothetical protein POM88_031083 [Heracleum sosnowskyi]|uniref:DUF6598 domain-containing protein n=1 Tax=Heracleum sosnowskyi TaxID=360622 RepID=A0AAD8HZP3_9APIA|nr:hypothetical protein POM88_031083 [Heracleum sosnowskyi]